MDRVYFDQASTSFPKGRGVIESMVNFMGHVGVNINRGAYQDAYDTARIVYETREQLCRLFDCGSYDMARNVIFTQNITYALNFIIKGFLKKGDHVLVSSMEHNAIMRPLVQLQKMNYITFDRIPCTADGELLIDEIPKLVKSNTKAIFMTHGSNVCGTLMPIEKVGRFSASLGIKFVVDTAQTAGVFPVSMKEMNIDAIAFTGHKGLLGPQGIGGFLVTNDMAAQIEPIITGGTGSISDTEDTPDFSPDKFEAGTLNLPGIMGLHRSLNYLEEIGIEKIREKEMELTKTFLEGVSQIKGMRIIGKKNCENRCAVVSVQCSTMDEAMIAFTLENKYNIITRVGMHCAPNAHKTLGTYPRGTLRFSFGYENTKEEIDYTIRALNAILANNHSPIKRL